MSHHFCWHLNNVIPSIVQCMMHLHCSASFTLELWLVASSLWLFIFMIRDTLADVVCSLWVIFFLSYIYGPWVLMFTIRRYLKLINKVANDYHWRLIMEVLTCFLPIACKPCLLFPWWAMDSKCLVW